MKKAILIANTPEEVRLRLKSVKIALQRRFGRSVPYWEVIDHLVTLHENQKHISGSKQIFPHVEG